MRAYKTWGSVILLLAVSGSCSKGKFEEGAESSDLLPAESENLEVEEAPATTELPPPIDVEADAQPVETSTSQVPRNPIFAECANEPDRAIVADLYQLAPNTQRLPDYTQLKSIKQICLAQLDIKSRKFSDGFPGVANLFEWFSLDMRFIVKIPSDGVWTFKLIADDGANLYITEQKVIDNDGQHPVVEKTGTAALKTGDVNFHVSYFQGPRFDIALELMWKGPNDTEFSYIPKANLKRPIK